MVTSDAAVIDRVRGGDSDAFALLIERYRDSCARLALRMLGDPDDAADAVQDAFVRAYLSLDRYEERERFGSWLLCIVANRCHSSADRARRRSRLASEWWHAYSDSRSDQHAQGHERDHALALRLSAALAALPAATREALVKKYANDLSYDEISSDTGVTVSALKMRVARGSAQLRKALASAGVTAAAISIVLATHAPRKSEPRAATVIACDTLRAIMRDTLPRAAADSMLPADRCADDSTHVDRPRSTALGASTWRIRYGR